MTRSFLVVACLFVLSLAASAQGDIRNVDFKNFTYNAVCIGESPEDVTVKNGEFSFEKQEDGYVDRFYFKILGIEYGDVTGDQQPEAVILSVCNTGGTGNFTEGFIFSITSGKPTLIARIPGGDRAYGGLRTAKVVRGILIVESNDVGELGGACCPEFIVTTRFRVSNGKLMRTGVVSRRDIIPTERVSFARGKSGITFKTRISAGEQRRFIVGAKAGQTLSVSVSSDDAKLRLLDEARVTEGINNFRALLSSTRDYRIQIDNTSSRDLEIVMNVKID